MSKELPDIDKANVTAAKAIKPILAQPSMIKRPMLELPGGRRFVRFRPDDYAKL